ncbi:MAG: formate dehydrogenase subunit gamma [Alphaproteobacteria bacterium]|nr:formate dehydrogenase subunit gamma [Alphaproteobacteria bacterium]
MTASQRAARIKRWKLGGSAIIFGVMLMLITALVMERAPALMTEAIAQEQGQVPGATLGGKSDAEFWRTIRQGDAGRVSGPNAQAGVMIQSEGDLWRAMRNGPLSTYGVWILVGMVALLALIFLLLGRVKIESGESRYRLVRFTEFERAVHWMTASSFVVLAITGLNLLYGRYFMPYIVGPEIFAWLTIGGKFAHNYLAFAFMIGLALMFVLWLAENIPNHHDLIWLLKGGGILVKGVHPPAKKFNAGQKIIFWLVMLGGASLSLSGLALLFPFKFSMFAETFVQINAWFGTTLPTALSSMQEQQFSQLWHAAVGVIMTAVIIAHIYIGSIGMEGAFDAMGDGEVDYNWAREHHNLWVKDLEEKGRALAARSDASD